MFLLLTRIILWLLLILLFVFGFRLLLKLLRSLFFKKERKPEIPAAELQRLLEQLAQTYPTRTEGEKQAVATKAAEEIKNNPTLKARVINAIKSGGTEAFKEAIDHPLVNILMATIEGWKDAE